jgi:hypothetical protein
VDANCWLVACRLVHVGQTLAMLFAKAVDGTVTGADDHPSA